VTGESVGRRLGERAKTNCAGKMLDGDGNVTEVTLKDISNSGARFEAPYGASIPRRFFLRIGAETAERPVELVRRNGAEAAVRFVAPDLPVAEPAPVIAVAPTTRVSLADLRKLAQTAKR